MSSKYIFVIDTSDYAGNFERQMCAYLTGQIGECGVAQEFADKFIEECSKDKWEQFEDIIRQDPGDEKCDRPVTLVATPGRCNNGNGKHGDKKDNPDWHYPAYESVGILFDVRPTDEMIDLMKERAYKYLENAEKVGSFAWKQKPDKILGFRLLEEVTTLVEKEIEKYIVQ